MERGDEKEKKMLINRERGKREDRDMKIDKNIN
jgi:hypothetical protein